MAKKKEPEEEVKPVCLAMDPGNTQSALVYFRRSEEEISGLEIVDKMFVSNEEALYRIKTEQLAALAIETPKARGELAANETFETMCWIGRFVEAFECYQEQSENWSLIFHQQTVMAVCRMGAAKDHQLRRGLIERFGGDKVAMGGARCKACGGKGWKQGRIPCDACVDGLVDGKKCKTCQGRRDVLGHVPCIANCNKGWVSEPGPLADFATHLWNALAVAVTWLEDENFNHRIVSEAKQKK